MFCTVYPTCGFREDFEISASEKNGGSSHVEFLTLSFFSDNQKSKMIIRKNLTLDPTGKTFHNYPI
jgi:hypothetical protein